jgi:succinate dehydrogenase/fumarate reductase flavoprotein subunit
MSSGFWAGAGAAEHGIAARARSSRIVRRAGGVVLRSDGAKAFDVDATIRAVQAEVFPYDRNWSREAGQLEDSLGRLDALWVTLRQAAPAARRDAVRAREAAAMVATARWMYRSAQARTETRGMGRRRDFKAQDTAQRHRWVSGGLDEVWLRPQAVSHGYGEQKEAA